MTSPNAELLRLCNKAIEYAENNRAQNGLYNGEVAHIARALKSRLEPVRLTATEVAVIAQIEKDLPDDEAIMYLRGVINRLLN